MSSINFNNSEELFIFQAFIEHVESHLAYEHALMRMQYVPYHINPEREKISNPILPNLHKPIPMEKTRNFDNNSVLQAPSKQHGVVSQENSSLFSYNSQPSTSQPDETCKFSFEDIPFIQEKEMEVSLIDGTKSLISLLDRPINSEEFTKQVSMNDRNLDLLFLDLELRL
ncbi:hypothetical protein TanjilG_26860 [Lupinus angustifolius]|uniref:Uncharacterized protein n=1 Tax=Lupinus angustifolius TaxID=3871 RepID=A0A4P1RIL0_LUPAN|nr:hypothetical protein TanjilG_26860 [Lupinus angustifolius]